MRKLTWIAACGLALGLIAAGCGDDGNDDTSEATDTTAELSSAEFVEQANEICKQGEAELDQAFSELPQNQPPDDAFIADTLVPNVQGQIDDIRALGPPADVSATLDQAEQVLADIEADPSTVTGKSDPFADVNKQLKDEGLTTCGSG